MSGPIDQTLIFGFLLKPGPNWQSCLERPRAPANYKDAKKIAEYLQAAEADLENKAARTPGASEVAEVVVAGIDGLVRHRGSGKGSGATLVAWFLEHVDWADCDDRAVSSHRGYTWAAPDLVGLDVRRCLRVAGLEYLRQHAAHVEVRLGPDLPQELWCQQPLTIYDPRQRALGDWADDVPLEGLCRYFGIVLDPRRCGKEAAYVAELGRLLYLATRGPR